jgi:hypothetical protein
MNFNKITINSPTNGSVIITPEKFYKIPESEAYYVVMYSLIFKHNNPEIDEIKAEIPYYISNGGTNKLRANMLYPFMCYSKINEMVNCPFDINRYSLASSGYTPLLLKYQILSNINIKKLEEDLLHTFLGMYSHLGEESVQMSKKLFWEHDRGDDLISVLERITNLLDFIICITNDVISNFDYKLEEEHINNGKYRPLSIEQKQSIADFTDLSIYGQETSYLLNQKFDNSSSSFNNHFRLVILTILNKYCKLFVDNYIINIERTTLHPDIISINRFNIIANICNKHIAERNMIYYKLISNQLSTIITEKIDSITTISKVDREKMNSIILQTDREQIKDDKIYEYLINYKWNSLCSSKGININTKKISDMNITEICAELNEYYEFISIDHHTLRNEIKQKCIEQTSSENEQHLVSLRKLLFKIRQYMMLYYYIGQLNIKFKQPNNTDKIIKVDIDSSETIAQLKSKIFDIENINPLRQKLSYSRSIKDSGINLENDMTIASYKILNKSNIILVVE